MKIKLKKVKFLSVYCLALFIISCATSPVNQQRLDEQISNIKRNISLVKRYPQSQDIASNELQLALENLKLAEQELKSGNLFKAKLYLDKAQSDAEYAKSKVRAVTYKKQLEFKEAQLNQARELSH